MPWFDPLLFPFSYIYDGVTRLRNYLFDTGRKKSISFSVPTIVVGNLSLGGTGKTPFVEFLIALTSDKYQVATLSRGYGRKTNGFILANEQSNARQIGDEPFQIFEKFGHKIKVAVGEERVLAIPEIMAENPETELIILDDAFQHRYVKADLNILLTTYQKPFFEDKVVPLGTLREARLGAKRADIIVVTKCPLPLEGGMKSAYTKAIRAYNAESKIIFAGINYGEAFCEKEKREISSEDIVVVSGIANDQLFLEEIKRRFKISHHYSFSDHHHYNAQDLKLITERCKSLKNPIILTTEKDAVKLKDRIFRKYLAEIPIFVLPIKLELKKEDEEYIMGRIIQVKIEKDELRDFE